MRKTIDYITEYHKSKESELDFIARVQRESYNQAIEDFYLKLIVSAKYSTFDSKLECWSNKQELLKSLKYEQ